MRLGVIFAGMVVISSARTASAGRGAFGWLVDTPVNPERIVELETWVFEENGDSDVVDEADYLWWGPTVGITDQVELALPIELAWEDRDTVENFTFERFGAEVRWRLATADPVEAPAFVPLVRVAAKRLVDERKAAQLEADLVASYDSGRAHLVANAGVVAIVGDDPSVASTGGVGMMVRAVDELRLGAELTLAIPLKGETEEWLAVGPGLAWTHGRFWVDASIPIGIAGVTSMPRLRWGVAF